MFPAEENFQTGDGENTLDKNTAYRSVPEDQMLTYDDIEELQDI